MLVLGLNVKQSGGLTVLWKIIAKALVDVDRRSRATTFQRGMARPVQALLARAGEASDPSAAHRSIAFLQAVKCGLEVYRGTPPRAMLLRCPPRFLRGEMDVLRPKGVIVLGWGASEPIREALGVTEWHWVGTRRLEHGRFHHAGGESWLVNLAHPSSGGPWGESMRLFDRLVDSEAGFATLTGL